MGYGEGGEMPEGGAASLWEDDDMRAFYENFPELKAVIPSILYSDSEKPTATVRQTVLIWISVYLTTANLGEYNVHNMVVFIIISQKVRHW